MIQIVTVWDARNGNDQADSKLGRRIFYTRKIIYLKNYIVRLCMVLSTIKHRSSRERVYFAFRSMHTNGNRKYNYSVTK